MSKQYPPLDSNDIYKKKEQDFINFIKNKRVCLVGPAPSLLKKKQGQLIDSYDIIIRMVETIYKPETLNEDYGSRNDIHYINTFFYEQRLLKTKEFINKGVKWVVFKCKKELNSYELENGEKINAITLQSQPYKDTVMGEQVVEHLLNFNVIKELYITGFTFYVGKRYYDGILNCIPNMSEEEKNYHANSPVSRIPHNINAYKERFKILINQNKIKIDEWGYNALFKGNY